MSVHRGMHRVALQTPAFYTNPARDATEKRAFFVGLAARDGYALRMPKDAATARFGRLASGMRS